MAGNSVMNDARTAQHAKLGAEPAAPGLPSVSTAAAAAPGSICEVPSRASAELPALLMLAGGQTMAQVGIVVKARVLNVSLTSLQKSVVEQPLL